MAAKRSVYTNILMMLGMTAFLMGGLVSTAAAEAFVCFIDDQGNPLRRVYVEHWFVPYMTDEDGCVTINTNDAVVKVKIHARNPVVRMSDGQLGIDVAEEIAFPRGVAGPFPIRNRGQYFRAAEQFRQIYNNGLREFTPWGNREFPYASTFWAHQTIEVLFPDIVPPAPIGIAYTEGTDAVTAYPVIHLKQGDLNAQDTHAHELGHALHFSALPLGLRADIEATYLGWLIETNGGTHNFTVETTPFVAFIEAFGMFAEEFSRVSPGFNRHQRFYAQARAMANYNNVFTGSGMNAESVEGAVFGTLFVEFAAQLAALFPDSDEGLNYVVTTIVECQSTTLQEYALCISQREGLDSDIFQALVNAAWYFNIKLHVNIAWGDTNQEGDRFGDALAMGDFDGDGYTDAAVGAPQKIVSGSAHSGAVYLFKGTRHGLRRWRRLTQNMMGGANEAGDEFGAALAAGDFNGDGISDLAIGTPNEKPGSSPRSGHVYVLEGSFVGPISWAGFNPGRLGAQMVDGDRFGEALAAGNVDGDINPATNLPIDDLIVGAPAGGTGSEARPGRVFIIRGSTGAMRALTNFGQGSLDTETSGERFGAVLAVADFNRDLLDDVAVGAPENATSFETTYVQRRFYISGQGWFSKSFPVTEAKRSGSVFTYLGRRFSTPREGQYITQSTLGWSNQEGAQFGAALAAEQLSGRAGMDLLIGAPGRDQGSSQVDVGAVFLMVGIPNSSSQALFASKTFVQEQFRAGFSSGARFGESIAVGDFNRDAQNDVVIGAPFDSGSGRLFFMQGCWSCADGSSISIEPAASNAIRGQGGLGANESGDQFGAKLASGDVDGDGDAEFLVSAPNEGLGSIHAGWGFLFGRNRGTAPWSAVGQTTR